MRRLGLAVLAVSLAAGCTSSPDDRTLPSPSRSPSASPSGSATPSSTPTPSPSSSTACPATYARPDDNRPRVTLSFDVADSHAEVGGNEGVTFWPDRPVTELVFRLWPNGPHSAAHGGSLTVTQVSVVIGNGRPNPNASFRVESRGTLLRIPLAFRVAARTRIGVSMVFRLKLPLDAGERFGYRGGTAWFASAFPMLAWERGRGWATDPPTAAFAEATTSEEFRLDDLRVSVPDGDSVLATGSPRTVTTSKALGRTYSTRADNVRDVMVAVSRFRTAAVTGPGGVPIRIGVAPGLTDDPATLARLHVVAMRVHAARFGPFPYRTLDVAVVPDISGGIEYPGAILLGTGQQDATLTHEVAHEWFYGLVGNNQASDPWLDEAFATYAEALHRGTGARYAAAPIAAYGRNRVGQPMTYWERNTKVYFRSVYLQGATMLLRARAAAGAAAWDRAIRCYVAANAHRVATPADLERALAGLPAALRVLRGYGALR